MTIAGELAEFVTKTSYEDLPPLAVERAKMIIASTIGSAAMGSEIGSSDAFRQMARERAGTPEASIWFDAGPKLPVMDAARTNAVMSDAAASDDSDLRNIAHIGTIVSSTAIAMGERTGAGGQDVLAAMVLGYEVAGRIGEAVRLQHLGFHTGVITIFGAAVAAGKLLNLTEPEMTHAIALAATSIGGIGTAANGSWAREYDAGLSSTLGITAALTAQKRFITEDRIMEMPRGFFDVYHAQDVHAVTQDLGKEWDIATDMAIKLVPGGHSSHAAAEAAGNAARSGNVKPEDVEAIIISHPPYVATNVHPTDLIGVAHSVTYMVACAVAEGTYAWVHAAADKVSDPVIAVLQDKVRGGEAPASAQQLERYRGAVVTVRTRSGQEFSSTVESPRGSALRGIDWADVDTKYRTLVPIAKLASEHIEESLRVIHDFDRVETMAELVDQLR